MLRRKPRDLEENHDPGRTNCFPLDMAAIRERAGGMEMAASEAGHMSAPDDALKRSKTLLRLGRLHMLQNSPRKGFTW